MLETTLKKELHHQRLKLELSLNFRKLHFGAVGNTLTLHFGNSLNVALNVTGVRRISCLGTFLLRTLTQLTLTIFNVILAPLIKIPVQLTPLSVEFAVQHIELPPRLLSQVDAVNCIGE